MISPIGSATGAAVEAISTGRVQKQTEINGPSFGEMLEQMAVGVAQSVRNAEHVSARGVAGDASVQEVVEAVMTAEQSLQAGIGIRDRVVNAYLEISRMAI